MANRVHLFNREDTFKQAGSVLSCQVGTDTVLLDSVGGRYYALDEVGSRIFELVAAGHPVRVVHERLVDIYDAGSDALWSDLLDFCDRLITLGIFTRSQP
jgi:hypothetical protein